MPAPHSRTLSPLLEHHKPVPADFTMGRSSITALPHPRGMPLSALTGCESPKLVAVCVMQRRPALTCKGQEREGFPMDGGSHCIPKEPFGSPADGKGSAHVLMVQSLLNYSLRLSGRQEVTSVIAFLCMTPSKTFSIR